MVALAKTETGCESTETVASRRGKVLAGFISHLRKERLPKRVTFGVPEHERELPP